MRLKKTALVFLALSIAGCSTVYKGQKINLSQQQSIPPEFVTIDSYTAEEMNLTIRVTFNQKHVYHILADEAGNFVAEGWYPTSRDETGRYPVTLKAKEGYAFSAGQKYLLCFGFHHPEEILYRSNNYQCQANIWLTLQ